MSFVHSTSGCPFGVSCHFLHYVPGGIKVASQMLAVKTRLYNKFSSPEGCKYGDKCHFAHGEWELGKRIGPSYEDPRAMGSMPGRMAGRMEPPSQGLGAAAGFGASATAKISIDASLAGAIIDPSSKNIELEGTFDQINQASAMVRELILNVSSSFGNSKKNPTIGGSSSANNFRTKLC
ncbi:hypothetical protein F3Y22_tig00000340pilonHSYRG00505 [Hibiscus syriacus]|uniref:C3H1-type domain-containing protein n=1 Tax=Hibiscus syriacus TaxID=106335 RepID=A0A6A3D8H3_HIBSY|nr:hypothetical protein F3Y22_tig00000340pilonHSYRG00505 [Hibiscus syriacus]